MADQKISALPASTTPLAGTEALPVVQSGATKQVSVANLTAGRTVNVGTLIAGTDPSGLGLLRVGGDAWLNGALKFASGDIGTSSANRPANIYAGLTVTINSDPSGAGALRVGSPGAWIGGYLRFAADGANDIGQSNNGRPKDVYLTGNIVIGASGKGILLPGGITWTSGAGSPEGVVTAPVGSLYSRSDGGLLSSLYVKESGSGNTGWVGK